MNDTTLDDKRRYQHGRIDRSFARRQKLNVNRTILAALLLASASSANAALQCYDEDGNTAIWRVGQSPQVFDSLGTVDRCIAWNSELTYIQNNFGGLRVRKGTPIGDPGPIIVYIGDDAAFIVANL